MKKILLFVILLLLIIHCGKNKTSNKNNENNTNNQTLESEDKNDIDFEGMKDRIKNSEKLDVDVFIAISVLHKYHISQYVDQVENLPKIQQQKYFEQKKKDFFNSIKYSEQEYRKFMENNIEQLNEYQNSHPAIRDYLTTIN